MGRNMWILAALIAAMGIAMIYQEYSGGRERPWAQCKESLVQQMFSGDCTPVSGSFAAPAPAGSEAAPSTETPPQDPADRPVGEIKLN
ncbi:MAG: hypothetical protein RLO51_11385 [Thalassobaculum sp.]|uniref:hypothetical protein n=1 Tax=Thalassobaculum sp. TaxID=2022740 RepID=UPI0032ED7DA9